MEQPERWRTNCSDLSPGQKQIITITRALLRNPRILILDEITASLDADTQELVATAIDTLMQGRTTVQIAHRLVVLQNSNRIICLEDGVVAQSGDHKSLMAVKDGMYRRMVLKQNLKTGSENEDSDGDSGLNSSSHGSSSDASGSESEDDGSDADLDRTEEASPKCEKLSVAIPTATAEREQLQQPLSSPTPQHARVTKDLSPPKQRWVAAIKWAMAASSSKHGCDPVETEDLLLELSVLKKDLSSGAALKDQRAIAEFQATASSLVERACALVQRVSREQARLEQLSRQVDRPPTTVISPSAAAPVAIDAAVSELLPMMPRRLASTEDATDGGLGLSRQLSRTRSRAAV